MSSLAPHAAARRIASARRPALGLVLALLAGVLALAAPAGAAVVATPPVVRTEAATSITRTSATLTATVNPGGVAATYFFQYGPTVGYGSQTRIINLAAGSAPVGVNVAIAGLVAGTRYNFRIVAVNALGTSLGANVAFATLAPKPPVKKPPVVRTGAATSVTAQAAVLTGYVNPSDQPTTYYFQYGTTTRYGSRTAATALAAGTATDPVTGVIAGLTAATTYHYRLVASSSGGSALGADVALATRAIPQSLSIRGLPNPVTFNAALSVVGSFAGTGAAGRAVVLQANPYPFTGGFHDIGNPQAVSRTGAFQFRLALPTTTQLRAVSVGPGPAVVSPTLAERVRLAVSTSVIVTHPLPHHAYTFTFTGIVSPADTGASVSLQRLVSGRWLRVTRSIVQSSSPGSSGYAFAIHRRHGGFYRVRVGPVDGSHLSGYSAGQLVHARVTA